MEAREHPNSWNWSVIAVSCLVWVQGLGQESSAGAAGPFNHGAISPAPKAILTKVALGHLSTEFLILFPHPSAR